MIQTNGTIPPTNAIAAMSGGVPLKPEKSLNISVAMDLTFLRAST